VEIDDPQHYPLTFNAVSKELMQSASMEFRVMAKGGAFRHGTHHARRSLLESRLLNWLHRLFHQPSTTTAEALTVIESVRLMHHVQRRLAATPMSGDTLLSGDFSVAVREAMEKRYGFLFLHRVGSSVDGGAKLPTTPRTYPPHPLYQLIIEGKPYRRVLESVAAHPRGTAAFPCDFTSLLSLPYERQAGVGEEGEGDDEAAAAAMDCDVRCGVDRKALHRWIAEALHYYGLRPSELLLIREGFSAFLTSVCADNAAESVIPSPAPLTSSVARLTCLLRLQATTHLSFHTLERVWACCAS
jgi:anaphase-promoting complex subunit 1